MAKTKSWREKMRIGEMKSEVVPLDAAKSARFKGSTMLLPSFEDVAIAVSVVPFGTTVTMRELQRRLAERYHADVSCPFLTGIGVWVAAHAAEEAKAAGEVNDLPWWRIIKTDRSLNPKFPGGVELHQKLLESEGISVSQKTSVPKVL